MRVRALDELWLHEPARICWEADPGDPNTHVGLLIRNPDTGFWLGYIVLGNGDHPWWGLEYDNIEVSVHGGLTFSDYDTGKHTASKRWMLGFDAGHAGDLTPVMPRLSVSGYSGMRHVGEDVYRDADYMFAQVQSLIRQAKEADRARS